MGHPAGTSSHRHALVVLLQLPHVLLPLLYPPLEALLCGCSVFHFDAFING